MSKSSWRLQIDAQQNRCGARGSSDVRLASLTYPNGRVITYSYGTAGGRNDLLNRVDSIQDTTSGTVTLASYTYIGG